MGEQKVVEVPPLPEAIEAEFAIPGASPVAVYTSEQMQDYAHAPSLQLGSSRLARGRVMRCARWPSRSSRC
jgi:hypothetical protein